MLAHDWVYSICFAVLNQLVSVLLFWLSAGFANSKHDYNEDLTTEPVHRSQTKQSLKMLTETLFAIFSSAIRQHSLAAQGIGHQAQSDITYKKTFHYCRGGCAQINS